MLCPASALHNTLHLSVTAAGCLISTLPQQDKYFLPQVKKLEKGRVLPLAHEHLAAKMPDEA